MPGTSDPDPSNPSYKQDVDQYIKENQTLTEENAASAVAQLSIEDSAYSAEHKLALERLFSSLKTLTTKEDMLQTLRWVSSKPNMVLKEGCTLQAPLHMLHDKLFDQLLDE